MKLKHYILSAVGAVMLAGMSGCSLLEKTTKFVAGSSGDKEHTELEGNSGRQPLTPPRDGASGSGSVSERSPGDAKAVKNSRKKGKKKSGVSKKELEKARKNASRGGSATSHDGVAADKQSPASQSVLPQNFSINGEWTVYSVRGNLVAGEVRPYINFDLAAKRFYGSNGCNYINGDLTVDADNAMTMDNIIATMKMCDDAPYEYLINLAVSDVRGYKARQEGTVTFLDLKAADNRTILVLRRHNMDFLNGGWNIAEINGKAVKLADGEEPLTMTINVTDHIIHGCTGCNIFNGSLFIDPDKVNSMQFLNIGTTRKACVEDSHETEFLLALECVETARRIGKNTVAMYSVEGEEILKIVRMNLEQKE